MSEVTLEQLVARQTELAAQIAQFQLARLQQAATTLQIPAAEIRLNAGEWYAGDVLNEEGSVKHRLIVAAVADESLNFDDTQAWAKSKGLSAPTKQESRLIVAHRYGRLANMSCFWTCEENGSSSAWNCGLYGGYVTDVYRSSELGGVAVRRLAP